jgi:hypothetical protein
MAAALSMLITKRCTQDFESCAIAKARQKNINDESEGAKADKFNSWLYHNIAIIKESNEDKSLGCKTVWHISAKETVNFN